MRARIIITGGMERSGTNYTNYCMFLHPKVKLVNYPTPNAVTEGTGYKELARMHKEDIPLPEVLKGITQFENYHKAQLARTDFEGVCFKYDRAEEWVAERINNFKDKVLFIYCYKPFDLLYNSYKNWSSEEKPATDFVRKLKGSVEAVSNLLRYSKEGKMLFTTMCVTEPMESIRWRFVTIIQNLLELEVSPMQELFLNERRVVGGTFPRQVGGRILEELYQVEPEFDYWIGKYTSLRSII